MDADHDSSQYYVEDILLLHFLITRFTEMLGTDKLRLVPVWAGLGLVALHQNKELERAFTILISSDSYTVEEVLTTSVDLFWVELQRLETTDNADYSEKKIERRPMSPRTVRKFLFWSWSEGRKMSKEKDFRFYAVWELISWLTLTSDEYIKAFDETCRFSESPVEEKLRDGLDVVKAAIFGRRLENNSFLADMLKSGITN